MRPRKRWMGATTSKTVPAVLKKKNIRNFSKIGARGILIAIVA